MSNASHEQGRRVHAFHDQQVFRSQSHLETICRDPEFSKVTASFQVKDFANDSFKDDLNSMDFFFRFIVAVDPTLRENLYSHIIYCFNSMISTSSDQKYEIMVSPYSNTVF